MALALTPPIFQGVTPVGALHAFRSYMDTLGEYKRYIVPCAGAFSATEVMAAAGVPTEKLYTGDISIYSCTLGYAMDPERSIAELGFEIIDPVLETLCNSLPNTTEEDKGAIILYALKWSQLRSDKDYMVWQRRQLEEDREQFTNYFAEALTTMKTRIGGLHHRIGDGHQWTRDVYDDPENLIFYNPPGYKGGYEKMFDPAGIFKWNEPEIPQIAPDDVADFIDEVGEKAVSRVLFFGTKDAEIKRAPKDDWHAIYQEFIPKTGHDHILYVNAEVEETYLKRPKIKALPSKVLPVYDDHEITAESKVEFIQCDELLAHYYYDLFVRELGTVNSETYYLFLIDGQVAGTCGFHGSDLLRRNSGVLHEIFGLTMTSQRYQRINRLLMMLLISTQFRDQICTERPELVNFLEKPRQFQTTCLSKYPEVKINRGLLKLVGRKQLPSGRFHLVYRTEFHKMDFQESLETWIKKHSKYGEAKSD